ncbi:hypothetical protein E2C01_014465 [Portunus trituberculatus]|uniref:Uncharacterized protein n=1 Tax=Portunus trituberculatus TaxID=210409 RepID=A0A5B7DK58_PORTR|nr:hypothetical protein [Portunus trituberculatus]
MCPSTEGVNLFSTRMHFHIHSGYYCGNLYSFRNTCWD